MKIKNLKVNQLTGRISFIFLVCILFLNSCSVSKETISKKSAKPPEKEENVYKIAVAAPQFGPYEALGLSIVYGAELAVNIKNENGGINGNKIELVKIDDGGLPGDATWRARDLVSQMILGVIGHLNSDISIPASEIYSKAKIPQISPGSTSPLFTERETVRGYVFRTIGRDDEQGKISADLVRKKGYKNIAVLYNNRPYGSSVASEFVKQLGLPNEEPKRAEVIMYAKYNVGKDNYLKEINLLTEKSPDVVFFIGEYSDAGKFIKQLRKSGLNTALIGSDGVFDNEFIQYDKEATNGALVISSPPIKNNDFIKKYKENFGKELGSYSATSFDATNILISAIEKVMVNDSSKIALELRKVKDYPGVIGRISFDSKGDLVGPGFGMYEVKEGVFKPVDN